MVDYLERDGRGLNLTWEVRDGILNHPWSMPVPATLEAQVVRFADRIAYVNHDVDDAVRAGVLTEADLPGPAVRILGASHGERVDTFVKDLVASSEDRPEVGLSEAVLAALIELRSFLFDRVYLREEARVEQEKAIALVERSSRTTLRTQRPFRRIPRDPRRRGNPRRRLHRGDDRPVRAADVRTALPPPGLAPVAVADG